MMDQPDTPSMPHADQQAPISARRRPILSIAASFLAGILGGMLGFFLAANSSPAANLTQSLGVRNVVDEQSAIIDVVAKTEQSIVSIIGTRTIAAGRSPSFLDPFFPFDLSPDPTPTQPSEQEISAGTGFFVTADGLVATNKHVVSDQAAGYYVLTNDGKRYTAEVVAQDPVNDLALLKVDGNGFVPLELGESDHVKVGQQVVAIGNALGQFSNTVTTGVVSGINRTIVASGQSAAGSQIEGALQTDAAINPGNSGGPLLDLSGFVIGINTAISSEGQLIGFAIPVNDLRKDLEVYASRKSIVKPYIGVRYVMITPALQEEESLPVGRGALVTGSGSSEPAVIAGSPAERAGLRERDIILQIDGQEVTLDNSVATIIRNMDPGDEIRLKVLRDGREIEFDLTLGERTA